MHTTLQVIENEAGKLQLKSTIKSFIKQKNKSVRIYRTPFSP